MTRPTIDSLAADWRLLQRFIRAERKMRERVFRNKPEALQKKLAECDAALAAGEHLKDAAKAAIPQQQPLLIDEVRKKQANGY